MIIEKITPELSASLCRKIIADIPEYFGLPEVNESYAQGVQERVNVAAKVDEEYVGLLSLDFPYPQSSSIYWLGILRPAHGNGVRKALVFEAEKIAQERGAKFMTIETLSLIENDDNYKKTYGFYEAMGFAPMFDLKPVGYECMMVYMVKKLNLRKK